MISHKVADPHPTQTVLRPGYFNINFQARCQNPLKRSRTYIMVQIVDEEHFHEIIKPIPYHRGKIIIKGSGHTNYDSRKSKIY